MKGMIAVYLLLDLFKDFVIIVPGEIVILSLISRCPKIIAAPPILQFLPILVLPAIPTHPAIIVSSSI